MPTCRECDQDFTIHPNDQKILDSFGAPTPILCATHSLQQRLAWRNERHLYKRTCELCKKDILAMYSPRSYAHVYCRECWYSDNWDPSSYGRPYDPTRSFHDQFADLLARVPHFNLFQIGENVNSDYCNAIYNSKDSYLSFSNVRSEGSLYCKNADDCRDCTDSFAITNSELLYDCVSVKDSYACAYLTRSEKCSDCYLGRDLQDCQNCFGCVNLKHKQWHWYNEPLTEGEYRRRLRSARANHSSFEEQIKKFKEFSAALPCEYATIRSSEDATGNYIFNGRNVRNSFFIYESENVGDCFRLIGGAKDNYRIAYGISEGSYASIALPFSTYALGCWLCEHCSFISYGMFCQNSDMLFGCIGLRKKKFCILNTQYSEDEYCSLTARIIDTMKRQGEWGEFLSPAHSPHGYNNTLAQEYFPCSRDTVLEKGWFWEDEQGGSRGKETIAQDAIPDGIDSAQDSITREIFACTTCGLNYKILKKELNRLKNFNLPIPLECPDCRFSRRFPRSIVPRLYARTCMCSENHSLHPSGPCQIAFQTTHRPEGKDRVYCNVCYQEVLQ